MVYMFVLVITLVTGDKQEVYFANKSDCQVARMFELSEHPTNKVSDCGTKWIKR